MNAVYELRADAESITQMQQASRSKGPMGFRITHGLIGSEEWWENVKNGNLLIHTCEGSVSGFWPGQWGDGPAEFQLMDSRGVKTQWLCNVEPETAKREFKVGRHVRVEFVIQERKVAFESSHESRVILSISVN